MIVDTTQSRTERVLDSNIFLAIFEAVGGQPDSLEPLIVPRRFRDCIYCLTRAEHPTTCKYDLATEESDAD